MFFLSGSERSCGSHGVLAATWQERSSAPTEQLSSENMLVGMMSTVVENRQGAVSRAASNRPCARGVAYVCTVCVNV